MKQLLTVLALAAVVTAPVSARETTPYTGTPVPTPEGGADVILEWDGGGAPGGFGGYYSWSQNTVVNFEAPAGGPWTLEEAQYYMYTYAGSVPRSADYYEPGALTNPPSVPVHSSVNWSPPTIPSGFVVVDVSSYGVSLNDGDVFGVGSALVPGDAIAVYDANIDGNPGHSWSLFYGTWYNDSGDPFFSDDGIRAGISGGSTPTIETTWGGVKNLYR